MIDLDKIRNLPQNVKTLSTAKTGNRKYNGTETFRFFRYVYNNSFLSNTLSRHFWNAIKDVWVERGLPRWRPNTSTDKEGVYDFIDGVWVRSDINWSNTNYTIHTFLWIEFVLKEYRTKELPPSLGDGSWDHEDCIDFLNDFGEILWDNRYDLFDDGYWKDYQRELRSGIDRRGEKCQLIIQSKHKEIWEESMSYEDQDIHKGGGRNDYEEGIDGIIYFDDDVTKTNQVKSCGQIMSVDDEYWVPVSLKYNQYGKIDYLSFVFGSNNNIMVINNRITHHREEYINGNPYHVFDKDSVVYINF